MADAIVALSLDLSKMRRDLAKLPNMTDEQAQKMLVSLERTVKKAESAAKGAAKGTAAATKQAMAATEAAAKEAEKALKEVGDTAGDTDSALKAVAGAVGLISPELEAVLNGIGDLSGGLEGLTKGSGILSKLGLSMSSLGPIAIGVAAGVAVLGTAYLTLEGQARRAEEQMESAAAVAEQLSTAHVAYSKVLDGVSEELAKVTGTLDVVGNAQEARDRQIRESAAAERKAAEAILETAEANRQAARTLDETRAAEHALGIAEKQRSQILIAVAAKEEKALAQSAQIAEVLREQADAEQFLKDKAKAAADAREAASAAAVQQAEQTRAAAAAEAEAARVTALRTGLTRDLMGAVDGLSGAQIEYEIQLQRVAEAEAAGAIVAAEAAALREAAWQDMVEANAEATLRELKRVEDERRASEDRAMAEQAQHIADMQANWTALGAGVASVAQTATDAWMFGLEQQGDATRKQLMAAFVAQKAAAIADIAVKTAQAVMSVWAQFAAYPPVAAALSVGAVAVGGIQAGIVAGTQPTFHRGRAPDEIDARVLRSESVLTAQATRAVGTQAIRDMNGGTPALGQRIEVVNVYKHRALNRVLRDNVRMPGSPLRKAVRGDARVGRRDRT